MTNIGSLRLKIRSILVKLTCIPARCKSHKFRFRDLPLNLLAEKFLSRLAFLYRCNYYMSGNREIGGAIISDRKFNVCATEISRHSNLESSMRAKAIGVICSKKKRRIYQNTHVCVSHEISIPLRSTLRDLFDRSTFFFFSQHEFVADVRIICKDGGASGSPVNHAGDLRVSRGSREDRLSGVKNNSCVQQPWK